jgi:hypothetical protein
MWHLHAFFGYQFAIVLQPVGQLPQYPVRKLTAAKEIIIGTQACGVVLVCYRDD